MNSVLEEMWRTGYADGASLPLRSHVSSGGGAILQQIVKKLRPAVSLEVGLAYGVSCLFISEALSPGSRHIVIDPFQHSEWKGVGLANLRRAKYDVEFYEETSQIILPRLCAQGLTLDFAFIDGMHTFDHTLVDFFYIDHMLRLGGVVAIDDALWPAVRKVCRFILTNRAYTVCAMADHDSAIRAGLVGPALRAIPRLRRAIRPEILQSDMSLGLGYSRLVAFRKEGNDSRDEKFHRDF